MASLGETFVTKSYEKGKSKVKPKPIVKNRITKIPKPSTPGKKTKPAPQTKPTKPNSKKPNPKKLAPYQKPKGPTLSGFLSGLVPNKPNKSYRKKVN